MLFARLESQSVRSPSSTRGQNLSQQQSPIQGVSSHLSAVLTVAIDWIRSAA